MRCQRAGNPVEEYSQEDQFIYARERLTMIGACVYKVAAENSWFAKEMFDLAALETTGDREVLLETLCGIYTGYAGVLLADAFDELYPNAGITFNELKESFYDIDGEDWHAQVYIPSTDRRHSQANFLILCLFPMRARMRKIRWELTSFEWWMGW